MKNEPSVTNKARLWERYQRHLCDCREIGLRLDVSRMGFEEPFHAEMGGAMSSALAAMAALESGAIANADEDRMVGHYWLRAPELAPEEAMGSSIRKAVEEVKAFAAKIHSSDIKPQRSDGFYLALIIGVGGSSLGPQLITDALSGADDLLMARFMDNTDPNGIDRTLDELDESLAQTLTIVISKSGTTRETHNGMLEVIAAYERMGLDFASHAVAITGEGSELHRRAREEGWLGVFSLWDWVGGRTSAFSPVGLLPAALMGVDIDALLRGARECDVVTRCDTVADNPAALLALMWYHATKASKKHQMVVLPYSDRLALFPRYLQQLLMESLGKEKNRAGGSVHEGLTVYGNKGSTDQHALVQQLRDGRNDFFVTFIEILKKRVSASIGVNEGGATTADYLHGFLHGTREALHEQGRESITLTLDGVTPRSLGMLVALFERAVGLYAELIDVNAYNQPGVEAGKKAADALIELHHRIREHLTEHAGTEFTAGELADALGAPEDIENIHHLLEHAAANDAQIRRTAGADVCAARYSICE